ncbi:MAG: alpha-2-macroglobulin [Rhodospirillaceae bacterium]
MRDKTLGVEGLAHGTTYTVALREGLPGPGGVRLAATDSREISVPNRAPSLAFRGAGYIMSRVGSEGLPLRSINVDRARLRILRMADRNLVEKIYAGRVSQTLSDWDISELVEKSAGVAWHGDVTITAARNTPMITPFPIEAGPGILEHGVYLATAEAEDPGRAPKPAGAPASQWFVVSNLGLTSFLGDDGLSVFAHSLTEAQPVAGVELHLLARNGKELAKQVTGADGIARFAASLARKDGDAAAQALFAYGADGDFGFFDLAVPGFDLSDRGAGGRAVPGPLDAFLYSDRGVYRPGDTVHLTALLRTAEATAILGKRLVFKLWRPDGFEADRRDAPDGGAGGNTIDFPLAASVSPGTWSITAHADAAAPALGRIEFSVLDFLSPRMELALSANLSALTEGSDFTLSVDGHYLFGAPAADLPGELSMVIRPAETPFPDLQGYRFGLAQEKFTPTPTVLPGFTTNTAGKAGIVIPAAKLPESTHPLEAVIRSTLLDIGGRPVSKELILPIHLQPFAIGVRPRFEGGLVPEGATATFDVIAANADGKVADGKVIDKSELSYELYEEEYDYRWFEANGRWDYETIVRDHRKTGGTLVAPAVIEEPVTAGRYRLEVFDSKSGVATSVRFAAGWWVTPTTGNRPDKVEVSVMLPRYHGGDVAKVYVRPPYDSEVLIAVADRAVRKTFSRKVPATGAFLDIPVDPSWTAGVTIIATAYAAVDPAHRSNPKRAIGVGWLAVDPAPHTLEVKLNTPTTFEPRQALPVKVSVTESGGTPLPPGTDAFVTISAVDETVLQLTDQTSPDPVAFYLGQRRLGVELRDVYGRLLDPSGTDAPATRATGPEKRRLRQVVSLPERDQPVVSLFSGIVRVGTDGTATIPLTLPDFDGRLRLSAVAWSTTRLGHAETTVSVHDRVIAEFTTPRFLTSGDRADITVALSNITGAPGDYRVALTTEGGLSLADSQFSFSLKRGKRVGSTRRLEAGLPGAGSVRLEITGPDGFHLLRSRSVRVRAADTLIRRHQASTLAAGETVAVPPELFKDLHPESVTGVVALSPLPFADLPGLALTIDRPMSGGGDRVAYSVLQLLAGGETLVSLGLDSTDGVRKRINTGLDRLYSLQRTDGAFARWSSKDEADPWITPLIVEVLDRAADAGFRIPGNTLSLARDWLKRMLDNGWFEDSDLPGRARTTYVLARAKLIDIGAVHYGLETYGAKLPSALAQAQLAAALALLGDNKTAAEHYDKVTEALIHQNTNSQSLNELAGLIVLGAENNIAGNERLAALATRLTAAIPAPEIQFSDSETAALTLAARAITDHAVLPPVRVAENDHILEAPRVVSRRFGLNSLPQLRNPGPGPLNLTVSLSGLPAGSLPKAENGLSINRTLFDMNGKPVNLESIHHNQLLVVILEGSSLAPGRQHVLVVDNVAAGLEIENVRLANSPQLGALSWLGELSAVRYFEFRNSRFQAVLDIDDAHPHFKLVYLARAVTRGEFNQPGATIEAETSPRLFGRSAVGRLNIIGEKD